MIVGTDPSTMFVLLRSLTYYCDYRSERDVLTKRFVIEMSGVMGTSSASHTSILCGASYGMGNNTVYGRANQLHLFFS